MVGLPMYVVEAFTIGNNQPFSGNTAGVCRLDFDDDLSDELKQSIGSQMNLAETAFISQGWTKASPLNSPRWTLRWFTPKVEVELCGHATLAAANIIFNEIIRTKSLLKDANADADADEPETTIVFESKFKGELEATMNWTTGLIALNFPSAPPVPISSVAGMSQSLWLDQMVTGVLGPNLPADIIDESLLSPDLGYLLFRLKSTGNVEKNMELLRQVRPDFKRLLQIHTGDFKAHSVTVSVQGSTEIGKPQFFSRFFAPWCGLDEDPVTGSAHTVLAPYWFQELRRHGKLVGETSILGKQLSARSGEITCSMRGTERVNLVGQSRLSLRGEFYPV